MKFVRVLLALSVLLGLSIAAEAKTTSLGSLSDGDAPFFFNSTDVAGQSFSDVVTFTLTNVATLTGGFFAAGIDAFKLTLVGGSSFTGVNAGSFTFGTYTFADLAPGSYTFDITGKAGAAGGSYTSAFSVAAVPEADTWLMIFIGVCLVAYQLRRKQRTLLAPRHLQQI